MQRVRIKLCGMMHPTDARLAAALGADAVGMVLHANSKRQISAEIAKEIVKSVPALVTTVGISVNADFDTCRKLIDQTGISTIQLHGDESPELVRKLAPFPVIKAVKVNKNTIHQTMKTWVERKADLPNLKAILLESASPQSGGSGVVNDFELIADLIKTNTFGDFPLILAGGLNPSNVAHAIKIVKPYAVDVSSGIEETPGQKSEKLMREFVTAVQGCK